MHYVSLYLRSGLDVFSCSSLAAESKTLFCLPKVVSVSVCAQWLCGLYQLRMKEDSQFLQWDNLGLKHKKVGSNSVGRPAKGRLRISPLPSVTALMESLPSILLSAFVNRDSFLQSDLVRLAKRSKNHS